MIQKGRTSYITVGAKMNKKLSSFYIGVDDCPCKEKGVPSGMERLLRGLGPESFYSLQIEVV